MASLILGGVGAAIGGYFGGPTGAQLGWAVGSTVGNLIDPTKVQGPKLGDLKVLDSAYGNMIPIVYGTYRLAGNVIWSSSLIEQASKSGGKGIGGPQVTTYTYAVSFAVALCEGPIVGIRRIWANGEIIFDQGNIATGSQVEANNSLTQSIVIYKGTEDQLPDPTISAHVGADNCPAYRGTAYLVFNVLQLNTFGNRTPNIECEVVVDGSYSGAGMLAGKDMPIGYVSGPNVVPVVPVPATLLGPAYIHSYRNGVIRVGSIDSGRIDTFDDYGNYIGQESALLGEEPILPLGGAFTTLSIVGKVGGGTSAVYLDTSQIAAGIGHQNGALLRCVPLDMQNDTQPPTTSYIDLAEALPAGDYLVGAYRCSDDTSVFCAIASSPSLWPYRWAIIQLAAGAERATLAASGTMIRNKDGTTINAGDTDGWPMNSTSGCMESDLSRVWCNPSNAVAPHCFGIVNHQLSIASAYWDSLNKVEVGPPIFNGSAVWPFSNTSYWADYGCCVMINDKRIWVDCAAENLSSTGVSASAIVLDLCERSGLSAAQVDVTSISNKLIHGYCIGQQMNARGAIDTLAQYAAFDPNESDYALKFVARGQAPALLIPQADMAAVEGKDIGELPDALAITRLQEMELPQKLTVSYPDVDGNYLTYTQYTTYPGTASTLQQNVQLPIAMAANEAAAASQQLLYAAWTARNQFAWQTSRKYSFLDPTDVIQVQKIEPDGSFIVQTVRISQAAYGGNGLMQFEAVHDENNVYSPVAEGVDPAPQPQQIVVGGPTALRFIDCKPLRDADNNAGIYVAASGYLPTWKGAPLFESLDNRNYQAITGHVFNVASPMGVAVNALGSYAGGNTLDELNTLTVQLMADGQLSSTDWLTLLNGANGAIVGNELIQFRDAILVSPGVYELRGLLRGRKGTEAAMASHAAGENFTALVPGALDRIVENLSDRDALKYYKAPSQGMTLDQAAAIAVVNNDNSLIPLSPVYPQGYYDGSNWNISWTRRTRIGGEWMNYVDAQLGETTEQYAVDLYADSTFGTVIRSLAATGTTSVLYTNAMQTADFGGPQVTIYGRIYQISTQAGRGDPVQFTLTNSSSVDPYAPWLTFSQDNHSFADLQGHTLASYRNVSLDSGTQGGWEFLTGQMIFNQGASPGFGTGDFTVEAIITPSHLGDSTTNGSYSNIVDMRSGGADAAGFTFGIDSTGKPFCFTGSGFLLQGSGVNLITVGQTKKIVAQRKAGLFQFFVSANNDPSALTFDSQATSPNNWTTTNMSIAQSNESPINFFCGRLESLKIYQGVAKYTA